MRMVSGAILVVAAAVLIAGGEVAMAVDKSFGYSIIVGVIIGLAGVATLIWGAILEGELGETLRAWGERKNGDRRRESKDGIDRSDQEQRY